MQALQATTSYSQTVRRSTTVARCPVVARRCSVVVRAELKVQEDAKPKTEAQIATEKYGLEVGVFKALTSVDEKVDRKDQVKQLLTQYGSAYLITSISFAIVSFGLCYGAVSAGVDVGALLQQIGLQVTDTNEAVGTFAIAYAAHKALSPVRFPPTVALTPVVARYLGTKGKAGSSTSSQDQQ